MTLEHFSQRALTLLYIGALPEERLLNVYRNLKSYEAGTITAHEMEAILDRYDADLEEPILPFSDGDSSF